MKTKTMMMIMLLSMLLGVMLGMGVFAASNGKEKNPDEVIGNLEKAIKQAEERGDYRCCLQPACTMCYLGKWKFEKGTCYCDDAIKEGRFDDVCPECKKGLEKGICESINNGAKAGDEK